MQPVQTGPTKPTKCELLHGARLEVLEFCRSVKGSGGTAAVSASVTMDSRRGLLRLIAITMRSRLRAHEYKISSETQDSAEIVEPVPFWPG